MDVHTEINSYNEQQAHTHEDVVIKVQDLKVWTPEEKSWWRRRPTKHKIDILSKVSGCIRRNEFAAVIGPSGAGKTTFLVSLAGKCSLPSSGTVTLHGRNIKECPGLAAIVPQHEAFMAGLSVMEHLVFMTEMKLGSCKDAQNQKRLNTLTEELKLKSHQNTPVDALSGGERKLLSLATALLSDPKILICDEPTTGLDSHNALLVVGVLKKLSLDGRVVLCSIHQPSCDIFKEFSSILLMAEGRLLFHGTQDQCMEIFRSIDLHCPTNYNPAEFYIRAVSASSSTSQKLVELSERRLKVCGDTGSSHQGQIYCKTSQRNWFKQVLLLLWRLSLTLKRGIWDQLTQLFITVVLSAVSFYAQGSYQKSIGSSYLFNMSQPSFSRCLHEVTNALNHPEILMKYIKFPFTREERENIMAKFMEKFGFPGTIGCIDGTHVALIRPVEHEETYYNRKNYHSLNVLIVITAIVLSVAYAGTSGTTQRGVQDVRGLLWLVTSEVAFSASYSALYAFEYELVLFKREVGIYKSSAYFVSRFLSFIPKCIVWPVTLVTLTTLAVDLPNHALTALEFIVALTISTLPCVAYGLGMAALFTSTGIMADVMPCVDLPLFLVSGAFLRISSLPSWMYSVKYISHFYYAMDAMSNIYWRQIEYIECPSNQTTTCVKDGAAVLFENGYSEDFILQDMLGVFFVTLFWSFLGYYGLKREERKGYAY